MLTLTLLLLLTLLLSLVTAHTRKRRPDAPPLISGWIPYVGVGLEFTKDPEGFLKKLQKKHGDVFTLYMGGQYITMIMEPLIFPAIMKNEQNTDLHPFLDNLMDRIFNRPKSKKAFSLRSFLLLQGEHLTPLIENNMRKLMLILRQDYMNHSPTEWTAGNLSDFCAKVMLEATFTTLFGEPSLSLRHNRMEAMTKDFMYFDKMFTKMAYRVPLWLLGPTKATRQRLLDRVLPSKTSEWKNSSPFTSFCHQNLGLKDAEQAAFDLSILWASLSNSISAMFWSLYYLLKDPEALQAVKQEIQEVMSQGREEFDPSRDVTFTREQLDNLKYLNSVINEVMRLEGELIVLRVALADIPLKQTSGRSVTIPKGDYVCLYTRNAHMDPSIFKDPQRFKFDRFVENGNEKKDFYKDGQRLYSAFMPFGYGKTMCPGRFFAKSELKMFLSLLFLYFDIELEDGQVKPRVLNLTHALIHPDEDLRFKYRVKQK